MSSIGLIGRNEMKRIKTIRYFLIEITFTLAMLVYITKLHGIYSPSSEFEVEFLKMLCLLTIILIWVFGPMLNRFVMLIFGGLYTFYLVSQDVYKRAFQQYYHFSTAKDLIGEVWGEKASAFEFIKFNDLIPFFILLALCIIFFIAYLLLQRRCISLKVSIPLKLVALLLIIPMMGCYRNYERKVDYLKSETDQFTLYQSEFYSFDMMQNVNEFVEKYGFLTYAFRDGQKYLSKNVFDGSERKEIAAFLAEQPQQTYSEYHGLFEGKNAFFIQAESFINVAVDPDLTPTLYRMFNDGIVIDGFNTPLLAGSTSDTEFMANTSVIPVTMGKSVCYNFYEDTFPVTLPGTFANYGFNPIVYHNNYGEYYNRTKFMPTLGYKTFFDCTGMGKEDQTTDSELLEEMKWIYSGTSNPYMAYWITYSGHQPYIKDSVGVTDEEWAMIYDKYPNISEEYASFFAKNMDLDRGLASFMETMEENGKLDDVVFIFYGDHIAKGIDYTAGSDFYEQTGITYKEDSEFTGLVFYNTATEGFHYYKKGTVLDLLPTVCDLWNFEYDTKSVFGRNLLDDSYRGFYFSEFGNWITNDYEYNPSTGEIIPLVGDSLDNEKITQEMQRRIKEREICNQILELDYFGSDENGN